MSVELERGSFAEDIIDELLPEDFDWRKQVRTYPLPALAVAAVGGFLIGRAHGLTVARGLAGFATARVADNFAALISRDPD